MYALQTLSDLNFLGARPIKFITKYISHRQVCSVRFWNVIRPIDSVYLSGAMLFRPQLICPRTKSMGCFVPRTMRPLDDASLGKPLPSLGRCIPYTCGPCEPYGGQVLYDRLTFMLG
jgi:hypothetical protein